MLLCLLPLDQINKCFVVVVVVVVIVVVDNKQTEVSLDSLEKTRGAQHFVGYQIKISPQHDVVVASHMFVNIWIVRTKGVVRGKNVIK